MGIYLNPDNFGFARVKNSPIYVDKSELIRFTNSLIGTNHEKLCVTRPRRFGKTIDLVMLTAYYSRGCDSRALFQDLKIAQDPSFLEHLNKHNVIRMDVQHVWNAAILSHQGDKLVRVIQDRIIEELAAEFPGIAPSRNSLACVLKTIHAQYSDVRFIFLLDEWDAVFRDPTVTQEFKRDYLRLLVSLFMGSEADEFLDLVYLTGILPPIRAFKDIANYSWLTGFIESSMLNPSLLEEFMGFTEAEVSALCQQWNMPMDEIKDYYCGYPMDKVGSTYCPLSVYMALTEDKIYNYWANTSHFAVIQELLRDGLPDLRESLDRLLSNDAAPLNPIMFRNNIDIIRRADDVLALLVHYGYLAYLEDGPEKMVRIPNREVRGEFANAVRATESEEYRELRDILNHSKQLLESTWDCDEAEVAVQIQKVHDYRYKLSVFKYNSEEALRSVINLAYFAADTYYRMIQELPSGEGFVDIACLPRHSKYIPMILELKWNSSAKTVLDQIRERSYQGILRGCKEILLVEISYEKRVKGEDGKEHFCKIELWEDPDM